MCPGANDGVEPKVSGLAWCSYCTTFMESVEDDGSPAGPKRPPKPSIALKSFIIAELEVGDVYAWFSMVL